MSHQALCGENLVNFKLTELATLDSYGNPRFNHDDAHQYESNVRRRLKQIDSNLEYVNKNGGVAPAADMRRMLQDATNELAIIYTTHQAMYRMYGNTSLSIDPELLDHIASLISKTQFMLLKIL